MAEKSLLQIQLENEAKAKEQLDKDQIFELNKAMLEGKDLNKAAKTIFGPGPDQKKAEKGEKNENNFRVKKPGNSAYNNRNYQ